eukprot:GILJ01003877.1.p1 GENE.GILJ01003877.1~~GILJ01003877.1.p1  ORF type:complete len:387 (-),score=60.87 GILJ01003877.1:129-1244(-)
MAANKHARSVEWVDGVVRMIDQRVLPDTFTLVDCKTVAELCDAIKSMLVRGAPAIGAAGGFGMALAAMQSQATTLDGLVDDLRIAKKQLDDSRPTAVNLSWATNRILELASALSSRGVSLEQLKHGIIEEAGALAEDDIDINRRIGEFGAAVVPDTANIFHHCNTGALATVDIGTALGVIFTCHKQNKKIHVWVDETRPRLQGSRLTAWELMRANIPMKLIVDGASGSVMRTRKVDVVVFGADRVAANGDVANKIGTYNLAVVAKENNVPVYACVPTSTVDLTIASGDDIVIEERGAEEITHVNGSSVAPADVPVFNPAFDVTPYRYLTGIITEEGICYPPFTESLRRAKESAESKIKAVHESRMNKLLNQ